MGQPLKPKAKRAKRVNISLAPAIIKLGQELQAEREDSDFSSFLTHLIKEEQQRRHTKPGTQFFRATLKPDDRRVAEASEKLTEDFKEYMARCMRDNADTGGKSAMFDSWALQWLAWLTVLEDDLADRIARLER
jgi:hypothetical protein